MEYSPRTLLRQELPPPPAILGKVWALNEKTPETAFEGKVCCPHCYCTVFRTFSVGGEYSSRQEYECTTCHIRWAAVLGSGEPWRVVRYENTHNELRTAIMATRAREGV